MKKLSLTFMSFVLILSLMSSAVYAEDVVETEEEYVMTVILHSTPVGFTSFEEGWAYALDNTSEYIPYITLYRDWIAGDTNNDGVISDGETTGAFSYKKGTDKGRLYISGCKIYINLNGYTIDRGLDSAVDSGQVFKLDNEASLDLNDKSADRDGCITGGYNTGLGGGFYLEDGSSLIMHGGTIKGNTAKNGGGVGVGSGGILHFREGSIVENHAENGGGVALVSDGGSDDELINLYSGYIEENTASSNGGGVYINTSNDSSSVLYGGTYIKYNKAEGKGGGMYLRTENKYIASFSYGSIEENTANMGGGVYVSKGQITLSDTKIINNRAYTLGGGMIPAEINSADNDLSSSSVIRARSGIKIYDNYVLAKESESTEGTTSNLYIGSGKCTFRECWNGMPSATNAVIGISLLEGCPKDEICLSDEESIFAIDTYKSFIPDNSGYKIVPKEDTSLYYNRYSTHCVKMGFATPVGIEDVTLAQSFECDTPSLVDYENKCVYITVNKDRKILMTNCSLNSFATFSFSTEGTKISESEINRNFVGDSSSNWQVIAPDNSYELWYIEVMPEGDEWSSYDDSVAVLYVNSSTTYYYHDFEKAWTDALVFFGSTLQLNCDFIAGDENSNGVIDGDETPGNFEFYRDGKEFGTNKGRLHLSGNNLKINLNGHKIDRGLAESVESGQVFKIMEKTVLEIRDDSSEGDGVITGGKNIGIGGGIYIEDESDLYLRGGSISGNVAENGGGVGITRSGKFTMSGGSISQNEATKGGGIFVDDEGWREEPAVSVSGSTITDNTALEDGGGICYLNQTSSSANSLTLSDVVITGNAAKRGGGVFVNMDSNAKLMFGAGTKIDNNTAQKGGGVYLNDDARAYFDDVSIKNNRAYNIGGGVYCDPSSYDAYVGGSSYICENYVKGEEEGAQSYPSNLYLHEPENNINHYTDNPLTWSARIGICIGYDDDEDLISGSGAGFTSISRHSFVADNEGYKIGCSDTETYPLYITKKRPQLNSLSTEKNWNGVKASVEIGGIIVDSTIVFAGYNGNKLREVNVRKISSSKEVYSFTGSYDSVKVMLLEDTQSARPVCKSKFSKIE